MIQKSNLEEISQNLNINTEINKQDEINKSQITLPQSMVEKKKEESNDFSKDSSNIIEDTQIVKTYEKVSRSKNLRLLRSQSMSASIRDLK